MARNRRALAQWHSRDMRTLRGGADPLEWDHLRDLWDGQGECRIHLAMSPHATDTCGPCLLRAAGARVWALSVPISGHVAQGTDEAAPLRQAAWLHAAAVS